MDESGPRAFPSTRWSLLLGMAQGSQETRRQALETLLRIYWKPLYHFVRRRGADPEAAEDVIQGFVEHLLAKDALSGADPERGRLRSFLRAAVVNYMINEHEKQTAKKRGGTLQHVSFTDAERELRAHDSDPERAYGQSWAREIMDRSIERLAEEYEDGRRAGSLEALQRIFIGPSKTYAELAADLGMTESTFNSFLRRARVRFREILTEEIADTVEDPQTVQDELAEITKLMTS